MPICCPLSLVLLWASDERSGDEKSEDLLWLSSSLLIRWLAWLKCNDHINIRRDIADLTFLAREEQSRELCFTREKQTTNEQDEECLNDSDPIGNKECRERNLLNILDHQYRLPEHLHWDWPGLFSPHPSLRCRSLERDRSDMLLVA